MSDVASPSPRKLIRCLAPLVDVAQMASTELGDGLSCMLLQVPGGARVPFLFTIKELQASGDLARFGSTFQVPSYRGSSFLDPKVSHPPPHHL